MMKLFISIFIGVLAGLGASNISGLAQVPESNKPVDLEKRRHNGKLLYAGYCLRCHGIDGSDTESYWGTPSLVDITQRHKPRSILDQSTAFVSRIFEGEDAAALIAYINTFRSGGYARPEHLVETSWVAMYTDDAHVRIVDVRAPEAYAVGHIPNAASLPVSRLLSGASNRALPPADDLAELLGQAGIQPDMHVAVYDAAGGQQAAWLWAALEMAGHPRVSVVNGGWTKWVAEQRTVSMEAPDIETAVYDLQFHQTHPVPQTDKDASVKRLIVTDRPTDKEGVALPWEEVLTGPYSVFKPAAALKTWLTESGVTPDRSIVVNTASGDGAAHLYLTLTLLGFEDVHLDR